MSALVMSAPVMSALSCRRLSCRRLSCRRLSCRRLSLRVATVRWQLAMTGARRGTMMPFPRPAGPAHNKGAAVRANRRWTAFRSTLAATLASSPPIAHAHRVPPPWRARPLTCSPAASPTIPGSSTRTGFTSPAPRGRTNGTSTATATSTIFGGHGALLLGHNHPVVTVAIQDALAQGTQFGANHPGEIAWAAGGAAPGALGRAGALHLLRHRGHADGAAPGARRSPASRRSCASRATSTAGTTT